MPIFNVRMKRVIISDFPVEAATAQEARAKVKEYGEDLAFVDFPNAGTEIDSASIVSVKPQEPQS